MARGAKAHGVPGALFATVLFIATAPPAAAQEFPEPANRDYTIDLYRGHAIGSSRIIGMGGAATATAQGSSGMIVNPAAPAVRATTSHDDWDWDWHFDSLTPALGSDYDNNGIATDDVSFRPTFTGGLVVQYKDWGVGFTLTASAVENAVAEEMAMAGSESRIRSEAATPQLSVARHFLDGDLVAGVAVRSVLLSVTDVSVPMAPQTLLELSGANLETGAVWKPAGQRFRVGGALRLPVLADETAVENCDPLDCAGYVLPAKVKVPWQASVGLAGRRGATAWNRTATTRWVDERALLWAVDLVLTGTTRRGAGLEAFGIHQLQPSGRKHTLSVRGGVDYEWVPGTFRVRGGSYWEPGRFKDPNGEDIGGRLHVTFGLDWRVWNFEFWDDPYRVRLSLTSDVADNFANGGLSIGFWH